MSETIYRMKSEWIDGHKLVKTVDTHDVTFFNHDNEVEELGRNIFETFGTFFHVSDGTAFSGEIFYEDILCAIDSLTNGEYNKKFSQQAISKCIEDFEYMKFCCEDEDEDFFEIYIL